MQSNPLTFGEVTDKNKLAPFNFYGPWGVVILWSVERNVQLGDAGIAQCLQLNSVSRRRVRAVH